MTTASVYKYSPAWFKYCFDSMADSVPRDIRNAAEAICTKHDIGGICDPGYISNVLAFEMKRGDGRGNFHEQSSASSRDKLEPEAMLDHLAKRIAGSYGCSKDVTPEEIRKTLSATLCLKTLA